VCVPHFGEQGEANGIAVLVTDITERKLVEKALKEARDELENRVEERTAELSRANDELRREIAERKRAEEALRESKQELALALRGADLGLWDWRVQTGEVFVNQRAAEILGYSLDEIQPSTDFWRTLVHPEDIQRAAEVARAHLNGSADYLENEQRIKAKFGQWRWVLARGQVVERDDQGRPLHVAGTFLDISDRKSAEKAIMESETRYRGLFENMKDGVAIYLAENDGEDFVFVDFNKAAEAITSSPREDVIGTRLSERFPAAKELGVFDALQKAWRTGESSHISVGKYRDRRIEIWVKNFIYKLPSGEIVAVFSDETERMRREEEQKRLATAVEQAAEAIVVTDTDGNIQYVNPAFERITEYSREDVIGRNPRILKSGEHPHRFYKNLWETIRRGEVWTGRFINKKKDGSLYHEEATITPVLDSKGQIINYVAVKRDITEHLELSRQLLQAQKMEAVGTLAGGIAHDFNNLLQAVLGYSELILMEEALDGRLKDDIRKINLAAENGADLVQRLLTFSRKTEIKMRPLNLNRQVDQVRKLLSRTIPKMIELQVMVSSDLGAINADPTQVEQILMNLAVNAKDAMPEGGRLIIRTENVSLDEQYCRTHFGAKPGDYVLLAVSDSGHGMNEETLEHIFDPFYTTKDVGRGTGLGLAMVYGIVKQHGGHITCSSETGVGTTFKIYFPALSHYTGSPGPSPDAIPPRGAETILLVDDEEFARDLGRRFLALAGYTVLTAAGGKEALELYKKERSRISLVVLDLIMPDMGGIQCLERLLMIDPKVRVLIASGYSADDATKAAMKARVSGLVSKPYDMRQILQQVREALDAD